MPAPEAPLITTQPITDEQPTRRRVSQGLLGKQGGLALLGVTAAVAGCGSTTRAHTTSKEQLKTSTTVSNSYPKSGPKVLLKGSHHIETEQATGGTETLANYRHASGQGPTVPLDAHIVVDCLATGPIQAAPSAHGNTHPVKLPNGAIMPKDHGAKWYHITAPPEFAGYFTASNAYDNGPTDIPFASQPAEDPKVPACPR